MVSVSEWLEEGIASIPTRSEATFTQLWDDERLEYQNGSRDGDSVDRANARLASSTLERSLQLLIVLPDDLHQRPPLLFGGALISQWWDRKALGLSAGNVLYFGTTVGIREHLSRVRVGRLQLSDVFPQSKASSSETKPRTFKGVVSSEGSVLPEVVCAYSPSDPSALLEAYRPIWIAIDCGNQRDIRWLPQLLAQARARRIPVIAWSQNPLSEVPRHFEDTSHGQVIRWPFDFPVDSGPTIEPIVVEVADDDLMQWLRDAYRYLAKATAANTGGRLATDALKITWRIQRQLEQLTVPFDLFESETTNYWGMQSTRRLVVGTKRFISELEASHQSVAVNLSEAISLHEQIMDGFSTSNPPLWDALSRLCLEDGTTDGERKIVFSSRARKQMFSLALLSRYNISEDDLLELGISLTSLTEMKTKYSTRSPDAVLTSDSALLTSLPSTSLSASMLPLMSHKTLDVLVLPFQSNALSQWVAGLRTSLSASPTVARAVIEARYGSIPPGTEPPDKISLKLGHGRRIALGSGQIMKAKDSRPLVPTLDVRSELSWYMDSSDEDEPAGGGAPGAQVQEEQAWVSEAFQVRASGGWRGFFAPEDRLNVVVQSGTQRRTEERFVRSLRVGDRILVIHGQRRQSLYELVISRVHNHPAMEIHLALIGQWQEELAESFRARRRIGWTYQDVLTRIRAQGSQISSTQTIRLWVLGQVLAPDDPKDLLRLARTMDMRFAEQYHSRINVAAQRIRGLHIGLSIRLNRWLKDQVTNVAEQDFEIFDDELGLSFQDFRDSLRIHTVESVQIASGLFLRDSLGSFEREHRTT